MCDLYFAVILFSVLGRTHRISPRVVLPCSQAPEAENLQSMSTSQRETFSTSTGERDGFGSTRPERTNDKRKPRARKTTDKTKCIAHAKNQYAR